MTHHLVFKSNMKQSYFLMLTLAHLFITIICNIIAKKNIA